MHFIIGALILFVLIYWLWPVFLAVAVIAAAFVGRTQLIKYRNLEAATNALPGLQAFYQNRYGFQETNPIRCILFNEIFIHNGSHLALSYSAISADQPELCDGLQFKHSSSSYSLISIRNIPGGINPDSIQRSIESFFRHSSISLLDAESLEYKVCDLMFLNLPELQWAHESIEKINNALEPVCMAYNASLTNELLAGNTEYLQRAIGQLQGEIDSLNAYAIEAHDAMRKIYEFLSIPASLKRFNSLDIEPLEVYSKQKEMREGFESAIAIKNEYDYLRGR